MSREKIRLQSGNEVGLLEVRTSPLAGFVSGAFDSQATVEDGKEAEAIMRSRIPDVFGTVRVLFGAGVWAAALTWETSGPGLLPN